MRGRRPLDADERVCQARVAVAKPALPAASDFDAVLFDAGGTLIELDFEFIARCAGEHGVELSTGALRRGEVVARQRIDEGARQAGRVPGRDADRRFRYFAVLLESAGVAPGRAAPIVERLESSHAEAALWRVEIEGAGAVLSALRARGVTTGVVSNADGRVEALLRDRDLTRHLALVVDSHIEGVEKPDPEIFRRALSRLSLEARRTLYVGDIYSIDALGARAAGLTPVLLDPLGGYSDADCATIGSLHSLLDAL
jgi:putative hydrolase of the HAD superfamily